MKRWLGRQPGWSRRCGQAALAGALVFGGLACTDVTFSHTPVIDFSVHDSVYVQPIVIGGDAVFQGYSTGLQADLISELRERSGFRTVTGIGDSSYVVVLSVELTVSENYDDFYDDDDDDDDRYQVSGNWVLRTLDGDRIDSGSTSEDGDYVDDTAREVIGEIAHHYLRAYRL